MAAEDDTDPERGRPLSGSSATRPQVVELEAALRSGGETGLLALQLDWAATPLGPMATWPPLLRNLVMTCMLSQFPMAVCWGQDLIYIYNDAVRPMMGRKHPRAFARPKRLVLPEVWDV